jgi:hypothetical protein
MTFVGAGVAAVGFAQPSAATEQSHAKGYSWPDGHDKHESHRRRQERFLYVATIAQSGVDPDFVAVIGADPRYRDFGKIVNRVDMPNVGDELHHIGYSADQKRLIVPGLFSNRIHILGIAPKAAGCGSRQSTSG